MRIKCLGVGVASAVMAVVLGSATAGEYSVLPLDGGERVTADGRYLIIDVVDTNYQRGTVSLDLVANTYEYYVGNRAGSGSLGDAGEGTVELPAIRDDSDITLWNTLNSGGSSGGGGGMVNRSIASGVTTEVSSLGGEVGFHERLELGGVGDQASLMGEGTDWVWRGKLVRKVVKYCKAQNDAAALLVAAAIASCRAAGGQHSGGKVGFCGVGADTGTCTKRMR